MSFKSLLASYAKAPVTEKNIVEEKPAKVGDQSFSQVWTDTVSFLEQYEEDVTTSADAMHADGNVRTKTIAILLIIQDSLPNEALWRLWLQHMDRTRHDVRVWIHAKHPDHIHSPWLQDRLVRRFQLRPGWGSLDLTKTMVCLLHEAFSDCPYIDHFMFASESCIPSTTVAGLYAALNDERSWIKYRDTPNNGYARIQQFDVLAGQIPREHILKGDQWVLLSRKHTKKLFQYVDYLKYGVRRDESRMESIPGKGKRNTNNYDYRALSTRKDVQNSRLFSLFGHGMIASDEMFFPTVLSMLGLKHEIAEQRITYAEWAGQAKSPLTYTPAALFAHLPSIPPTSNREEETPQQPCFPYTWPSAKLLHANLSVTMQETTCCFLRKIQFTAFQSLMDAQYHHQQPRQRRESRETYDRYDSHSENRQRDGGSMSSTSDHDEAWIRPEVRSEIESLQRWLLWIHREDADAAQREWSSHWREICWPIVQDVLLGGGRVRRVGTPVDHDHRKDTIREGLSKEEGDEVERGVEQIAKRPRLDD